MPVLIFEATTDCASKKAEPIDGSPDQFFGLGPPGSMLTTLGLMVLTAAYLVMALIRITALLISRIGRGRIFNLRQYRQPLVD